MSGLSLHEATIRYLDALTAEGTPLNTRYQYGALIRRLLRRHPDRKFASITAAEIADFLYGPAGALVGKATSTGTCYRAALRSFFGYGHLMGWRRDLLIVPMPIIRSGQKGSQAPPTRLTTAQLALLLEEAEHPMVRAMVAVAINTALRICDIRKISIGDVNFHTGEIAVWVQKTKHFDAMPITLDLDEELRRYLLWYTDQAGITTADSQAFLFPGWDWDGRRPVLNPQRHASYPWAWRRMRELLERSGVEVEPREAWHVIRRSVARIYFDSLRGEISYDHALRQTAALLGHKNVATTERYLGLDVEIAARNESLRGKRFITGSPNVVPLRAAG